MAIALKCQALRVHYSDSVNSCMFDKYMSLRVFFFEEKVLPCLLHFSVSV